MLVLLRWWFLFCLIALGACFAWMFDLFQYLYRVDRSFMAFSSIFLFAFVTVWIGRMTYAGCKGDGSFRRHLPVCWFLTEAMMGFGMIGTLIGFLVLLSSALGTPINTADTAAMTALISKMGIGFATAAVTTLVGLACSLVTKLQLINLEYLLEDEEQS